MIDKKAKLEAQKHQKANIIFDEQLNDDNSQVNQVRRFGKASVKQMILEQFSHAASITQDRQRTTTHNLRIEPESECRQPMDTQQLSRVSMPDVSCIDNSVANLARPNRHTSSLVSFI